LLLQEKKLELLSNLQYSSINWICLSRYPVTRNEPILSQTTEYALRAAVWLAQNHGTSQTTQQIASATKVPAGYLSKVLQGLGRGGLVRALRGKGGGFELCKPPAAMTILEIVRVVDPIQRIHSCPLGLDSHSRHLCPLHHRIDQALASIEASFDSTSLADLLAPQPRESLCKFGEESKSGVNH